MTTAPSFSIIVPTFQRRKLICENILALDRLDYDGPFEIIVVVDGSTDGTAAALSALRPKRPLRVIEQSNRGLAAARNAGAARATRDILLFLDDDLIAEPALLHEHARSYVAGAEAVTGEIPLHPNSTPGLITDALSRAAAWERKDPVSAFDVYGGHLSVKRTVFEKLGGFDEDLHLGGYGGEDLDFGLRLTPRFNVRHNCAAIAHQLNVIGPREHMRRARQLALSDLRLSAKHPLVAADLFRGRGASRALRKSLSYRLSGIPALPNLIAFLAVLAAEGAQRTRQRSNPLLAKFYFAARSALYWSHIRKGTDAATLRELVAD